MASEGEAIEVASADEIPDGEGLVVEVAGEQIAIFELEDGYYALDHVCTHQGGPLGEGKVEGGCVYCPWHGHEFDIKTGEHANIDRLDAQTFEVEERDGGLYVHV